MGKFNQDFDEQHPGLQKYTHGMIRNFACDLVLPEFDNEIDRMLREYRAHSPELYLIDKIQKRTMELRGHLVYWSWSNIPKQ